MGGMDDFKTPPAANNNDDEFAAEARRRRLRSVMRCAARELLRQATRGLLGLLIEHLWG